MGLVICTVCGTHGWCEKHTETVTPPTASPDVRRAAIDTAMEVIAKLTDEERREVIRVFCYECGAIGPCTCWNDE